MMMYLPGSSVRRDTRPPEYHLSKLTQAQLPKLDVYSEGIVFLELLRNDATAHEMMPLKAGLRCEWDAVACIEGAIGRRDDKDERKRKMNLYEKLRAAHDAGDYETARKLRAGILQEFLGDDLAEYAEIIAQMIDPVPESRLSHDHVVEWLRTGSE